MLDKYTEVLKKVRNGKISIEEFHYQEEADNNGNNNDLNARKRYKLLIAIQYNFEQTDEKLIKQLFEYEIINHIKNPDIGILPSLLLNAYLLSKFRKPEYALLFLKAKQCNYDTHCSFDYQYLVSAGIKKTYDFLVDFEGDDIDNFYSYMGDTPDICFISERDLEEWRSELSVLYPGRLSLNTFKDEIQLAIEIEEMEELGRIVDRWQDSKESWTKAELNELNYYRGVLEDYRGQVWANEKLFKLMDNDWDKAYILKTLSTLYLGLEEPVYSWDKIKQSHIHLSQIPDWREGGLGRFLVENAFDVVLLINDASDAIAREAYTWAITSISGINDLHHNLLDKTARSAEIMGDLSMSHKYFQQLKEEQKKLDSILNQAETLKLNNLNDASDLWQMEI